MKIINKRLFITAAIALSAGTGILLSVNQPVTNNGNTTSLISEDTAARDTSSLALVFEKDTADTSSAATKIFALVDTIDKDSTKLKLNQLYTLLCDTTVSSTTITNQLPAILVM
jgi:hypothetical protein